MSTPTCPWGMHPDAWAAFLRACSAANETPRHIVQTIGNAPASCGTHLQDGTDPVPYSAATDIRSSTYTTEQNEWFRLQMIHQGFVPYWRHTGSFAANQHFHVVWPGCKMKASLRSQVHDFLAAKDGLADHTGDDWLATPDHLSEADAQAIRTAFLAHNQADW